MPPLRFGDRTRFSVEPGDITPPSMRVVDLWAAGKHLTPDDNTAYLPSLTHYMRLEIERIRGGEIPPCPFPGRTPEQIGRLFRDGKKGFAQQFWFLRWSEILDDVSVHAYRDDDLVIMFAFHADPETVFSARISPDEFISVVENAADRLDADLAAVVAAAKERP